MCVVSVCVECLICLPFNFNLAIEYQLGLTELYWRVDTICDKEICSIRRETEYGYIFLYEFVIYPKSFAAIIVHTELFADSAR